MCDLSEVLFRDDAMILNVGLPGETSDYISRNIACEYTLEGEFVRQIGEVRAGPSELWNLMRIAEEAVRPQQHHNFQNLPYRL